MTTEARGDAPRPPLSPDPLARGARVGLGGVGAEALEPLPISVGRSCCGRNTADGLRTEKRGRASDPRSCHFLSRRVSHDTRTEGKRPVVQTGGLGFLESSGEPEVPRAALAFTQVLLDPNEGSPFKAPVSGGVAPLPV